MQINAFCNQVHENILFMLEIYTCLDTSNETTAFHLLRINTCSHSLI